MNRTQVQITALEALEAGGVLPAVQKLFGQPLRILELCHDVKTDRYRVVVDGLWDTPYPRQDAPGTMNSN